MSSHISREMRSRMVRAFSRALVMHCTMELGLSWRNARNSKTVSRVGFAVELAETLFFAGHDDQRIPAQAVGSLDCSSSM